MKTKKILALMTAMLMTVGLLAGCGGQDNNGGDNNSGNDGGKDNSAAPIVLQIGHGTNAGSEIDQALHQWDRLLQEKSGGTMAIEVFPSSQLGSTTDIFDQMIAGANVGVLADGAYYADQGVPDMGILFGPYLFESWDDCWTLIESDWYKEQSEILASKGIQLLTSNWIYGDRHTLTVKPVNSVDDLKGMKIRVPNNTIQCKGFEVLGATPTPMALGDVYTSLNQKTIDGLENPLAVLYDGKFHEVAKYLVLDGHVKNFTTWVCGTIWFNTLTEEQQGWLIETGNQAGLYNNELQAEADATYLQKLKDEGVTVKELTEEERDAFVEAAQSFYTDSEVTKNWSPNLYETVMAAMGK